MNETNWAGNYSYRASGLHRPSTIDELQSLVASTHEVKALGTRHCFNDIADTDGVHISLENLTSIELHADRRQVTIDGGVRYGELGEFLHRNGWALHNLASLPHITVAGACATATHGSGVGNGNLATAVAAVEVVTANGAIVKLTRGDDRFPGAVVNLGALGIVARLTLDIEPTFDIRQYVYVDMPFAEVEAGFDAIMSSAYSVSLFTLWRGDRFTQCWRKSRTEIDPTADFFGAKPAGRTMHPIPNNDPVNATEQLGVPGPWHERLPHFRYGFQPSNGNELQAEYYVPLDAAVDAMRSLWPLGDLMQDQLLVSEVRCIAADDLWLSPCYGQDCVAFHFTWKRNWPVVSQLLPRIEAALAPFNARPHWGKLYTIAPDRLPRLFPKLGDFQRLVEEFDPTGKFRNDYLSRYLFSRPY